MYSLLGRAVIKARWFIVAGVVAVFAIGSTWGLGVFDEFTDGGFVSSEAESVTDAEAIEDRFGSTGADVVVLYESEDLTADDPEFSEAVTESLDDLAAIEVVESVTSYYDTQIPDFVSNDRHAVFAAINLEGSSTEELLDTYETFEGQAWTCRSPRASTSR
ncbi:hypothetical protein GCM10029992_60630 [Glycomyces albus]